jgi:formylglycine-generating enzyme required for sulfatase activity/serine/threonine protein kinase
MNDVDKLATLVAGENFGPFKILRCLGCGGMGTVYEVEYATTKNRYAVKILPAEFSSRIGVGEWFKREASRLANIAHPCLATTDEFGLAGERHWLRMELLPGAVLGECRCRTMSDVLVALGGRMPQRLVAQVLGQVLSGLAHLHKNGESHRNLKLANIMLTDAAFSNDDVARGGVPEITVRLVDTGLVRLVGERWIHNRMVMVVHLCYGGSSNPSSLRQLFARFEGMPSLAHVSAERTALHAYLASFECMSPEQRETGMSTVQSDVYSMGAIAYRLLTGVPLAGHRPEWMLTKKSKGKTNSSLASRLRSPSRLVPGLNPIWDEIIIAATDEAPARRFASAGEMLHALVEGIPGVPVILPRKASARSETRGSIPVVNTPDTVYWNDQQKKNGASPANPPSSSTPSSAPPSTPNGRSLPGRPGGTTLQAFIEVKLPERLDLTDLDQSRDRAKKANAAFWAPMLWNEAELIYARVPRNPSPPEIESARGLAAEARSFYERSIPESMQTYAKLRETMDRLRQVRMESEQAGAPKSFADAWQNIDVYSAQARKLLETRDSDGLKAKWLIAIHAYDFLRLGLKEKERWQVRWQTFEQLQKEVALYYGAVNRLTQVLEENVSHKTLGAVLGVFGAGKERQEREKELQWNSAKLEEKITESDNVKTELQRIESRLDKFNVCLEQIQAGRIDEAGPLLQDFHHEETIELEREAVTGRTKVVSLPEGVVLELVFVPPGEFTMGSPPEEEGHCDNEGPTHPVKIAHGFWIGKFPVTQSQWHAVTTEKPGHFGKKDGARHPVESVSWNDCQEFLTMLNKMTVHLNGRFRLPTEAEWEYACRAGTVTGYAGAALEAMGWYEKNSEQTTHPVGLKEPNAWGLYDMHGNVEEWCNDWYGQYSWGGVVDPIGASVGSFRVVRGGCWQSDPVECRSAYRNWQDPQTALAMVGCRVVFVPNAT